MSRTRKSGAKKVGNALKIAHVLFMDLVGYSKLPMEEQDGLIARLQRIVTNTVEYKVAVSQDELIPLPTGDGMALVFREDPTAPARCALAVAGALRKHPEIKLRMGINSGPVLLRQDIRGNPNASGAGINYAQRVMDCGDAGHILLSENTARDLSNLAAWKDDLYDLGEFTVKHGHKIHLYNLLKAGLGNPQPPTRQAVTEDPSHYLEALREDNRSIEIRGLKTGRGEVYTVPLEDLYIPLMTAADPEAVTEKGPTRPRTVPLEEALQHPRLVIIGDPGSGKSTFLKWVVTKSTNQDFPVLIRGGGELAAHIRGCKPGDGPSTLPSPGWLPHFLGAQSAENKWGLSAAYFDSKLEEGCLVMVDGVDEASSDEERQSMAKLLHNATRAYAKSRFVVTTRPQSYTEKTAVGRVPYPLDCRAGAGGREEFSEPMVQRRQVGEPARRSQALRQFVDAVGKRPEILRMAKNPVMLTALAVLHWNDKKLPDQRAELYGSILDWLAESRHDRPGREKKPRQCIELIQRLALAMQLHPEGRQVQIPRYWAAEALHPERLATARRFLEEEEKDSGIIVSRGADVRFWHLTFQEFLAAKELGGQDALRGQLTKDKKLFSSEWREVVLLLAGVLYEQGKPRVNDLTGALLDTLAPNASLADQARCVGLLGAIIGR